MAGADSGGGNHWLSVHFVIGGKYLRDLVALQASFVLLRGEVTTPKHRLCIDNVGYSNSAIAYNSDQNLRGDVFRL